MILPQNGRVVIIDDNPEEGLPLVKVLAKHGVPTTYFTGQLDELPSKPLMDVRLVFLDIVIGMRQPEKTQIGIIRNILRKIIDSENGPYILLGWTKHNELLPKITNFPGVCPPVLTFNLEKAKCKTKEEDFDLAIIESRLKQELEKAGIFHLFVLWENIVHKSSNHIVKNLHHSTIMMIIGKKTSLRLFYSLPKHMPVSS